MLKTEEEIGCESCPILKRAPQSFLKQLFLVTSQFTLSGQLLDLTVVSPKQTICSTLRPSIVASKTKCRVTIFAKKKSQNSKTKTGQTGFLHLGISTIAGVQDCNGRQGEFEKNKPC